MWVDCRDQLRAQRSLTNMGEVYLLLGMVYDETKNYDNSFHVGGAMMMSGGLLLCLLHLPQLKSLYAVSDNDKDCTTTDGLPLPHDDEDVNGHMSHDWRYNVPLFHGVIRVRVGAWGQLSPRPRPCPQMWHETLKPSAYRYKK